MTSSRIRRFLSVATLVLGGLVLARVARADADVYCTLKAVADVADQGSINFLCASDVTIPGTQTVVNTFKVYPNTPQEAARALSVGTTALLSGRPFYAWVINANMCPGSSDPKCRQIYMWAISK